MLSVLERKRKESELARVHAARLELEFRIMELEENVQRLKQAIEVQKAKEAELASILAGE